MTQDSKFSPESAIANLERETDQRKKNYLEKHKAGKAAEDEYASVIQQLHRLFLYYTIAGDPKFETILPRAKAVPEP